MINDTFYSQCSSIMEDIMVRLCLKNIFQFEFYNKAKDLTLVKETIDQHGRERFHSLSFRLHFNGPLNNKNKRECTY